MQSAESPADQIPTLSVTEREAILQREVARYVRQGWQVTTRTETAASLVRKAGLPWWVHLIHLILAALTSGLWIVVWLVHALIGTKRLIELDVGTDGHVYRTEGRP